MQDEFLQDEREPVNEAASHRNARKSTPEEPFGGESVEPEEFNEMIPPHDEQGTEQSRDGEEQEPAAENPARRDFLQVERLVRENGRPCRRKEDDDDDDIENAERSGPDIPPTLPLE